MPVLNGNHAGPTGATGATGAAGADGAAGVGVPAGGSTAQVLKKLSATDYDTYWAPDDTGGGGGGSSIFIDATDVSYGVSTGATAANNATYLAAADTAAAAAGKTLYIPYGTYTTNSVTFSARVRMEQGSIISVPTGQTIAFNGGIDFSISQHFTLAGTALVTLSPQKTRYCHPEYWGAVSNDAGTDCLVAIQYALRQAIPTYLMGASYYTSGKLVHDTLGASLIGTPSSIWYSSRTTQIICTSTTATVFEQSLSTGWNAGCIKDVMFSRSVAPSAGCIGVNILQGTVDYERCTSNQSSTGWKINGVGWGHIKQCNAFRTSGSDDFIGFWCDGTVGTGFIGGNASLYLEKTIVQALGTYSGTATGYYLDKSFMDVFMNWPECEYMTYGIKMVGNSGTGNNVGNQDFRVDNMICEAAYPLHITNIATGGVLQFNGGYLLPNTTTGIALTITDCPGAITLTNMEYAMVNATNTNADAIKITNSNNVTSESGIILNCSGYAISLNGADNCRFSDRIQQITHDGKGINLVDSNRNTFNSQLSGVSRVNCYGYLVDNLSDYNEFNCSGIDPARLASGSVYKLKINGTGVTAVGISALGAGHNVASGVMN